MIQTLKMAGDVSGKVVLLRVDYNVPLNGDGSVRDDSRIVASLPTLHYLLENGARVVLMSHLGRPSGDSEESLTLDPVREHLEKLLGKAVQKVDEVWSADVRARVEALADGELLMLENVRFRAEEKKCDLDFAKDLASAADLFVFDAFGTAHRKHCSTWGVAQFLPTYAGFLMEKEMKALQPAVSGEVARPLTMVFGGAKIDTKIGVIEHFLAKADYFLVGGGLANTFLKARGLEIGASLCENDKLDLAREILARVPAEKFILPLDVVVAKEVSPTAEARVVSLAEIAADDRILDIGPATLARFKEILGQSGTVIWNGPLGLYELPQFAEGSYGFARALADSEAFSIVGGGDTADCIKDSAVPGEKFDHISTGGGACIEFLSGIQLPGVQILEEK